MSFGVISRTLVGVFNLSNSFRLIRRQTSTREGRYMKKILKETKKKKGWRDGDLSLQEFVTPQKSQNNKRVVVLNNLFMENISSLIATGEVSHELGLPAFEISKVKMASDFKQLNVYWLPKDTENELEFEKSLNTLASRLRHELTQLRIMGNVPKICFCKDKTFSNRTVVEKLLETADFGDDFVPQVLGNSLKEQFSESEKTTHNDQSEEQLPCMRMDVFGLDHNSILEKIKRAMKKSKATHRYEHTSSSETDSEIVYSDEVDETINPKKQRQELIHFLRQRKIMTQKLIQHRNRMESKEQYYNMFECNKLSGDSTEEVEESDFFSEEYERDGCVNHENR